MKPQFIFILLTLLSCKSVSEDNKHRGKTEIDTSLVASSKDILELKQSKTINRSVVTAQTPVFYSGKTIIDTSLVADPVDIPEFKQSKIFIRGTVGTKAPVFNVDSTTIITISFSNYNEYPIELIDGKNVEIEIIDSIKKIYSIKPSDTPASFEIKQDFGSNKYFRVNNITETNTITKVIKDINSVTTVRLPIKRD